MHHFHPLQERLKKRKDLNYKLIEKAYDFAHHAHNGQKRKSGEDYIIHPVAVARVLCDVGADENLICAGLLHDVLEDCQHVEDVNEKLHKKFGSEIYYLVDCVSKDRFEDAITVEKEYFKKLHHALEMDLSIFFLKIADLMHNLETISSLKPERQKTWLHELKYEFLPLFSTFFHIIPAHYQEIFNQMMMQLEESIAMHEKKILSK